MFFRCPEKMMSGSCGSLEFQLLLSSKEARVCKEGSGTCTSSAVLAQCDSTTCLLTALPQEGNEMLKGNKNDSKDRHKKLLLTLKCQLLVESKGCMALTDTLLDAYQRTAVLKHVNSHIGVPEKLSMTKDVSSSVCKVSKIKSFYDQLRCEKQRNTPIVK